VSALTARDAERVLRFVAEAEDIGGDEPFTPELLVELGRLVSADWIGYSEKDRRRHRLLAVVERVGDEELYAGVPTEELCLPFSNALLLQRQAGYLGGLRLSGLLTPRELRATEWYVFLLRRFGLTDILECVIPAPEWHAKTFVFDRMAGTFSDRDVLVLDCLQPHFARLWRAAQTRRTLRAALASLESASEHDPRGVIVVGRSGRIDYASPAARRLLREYFGSQHSAELPPTLADWVDSGAKGSSWPRGDRRLTIDRVGDALMLGETRGAVGLTEREREVLALVAKGKTNAEIAETLWITPSTVRKHLENVYAKLGVRTRTAAAARFLGALDDDSRTG
jgi:DNA-binding CsgD family transcriptional regulator